MAVEAGIDAARALIDAEPDADEEGARRGRPAVATQIVQLVTSMATELCHDADGVTYVRHGEVPCVETWSLNSRTAREWISHLYYRVHGSAPRSQALADAIATLAGIARYEGIKRDVHLRTAHVGDAVVHDLGDDLWRAVTITTKGWSISAPSVIFRRPSAARRARF